MNKELRIVHAAYSGWQCMTTTNQSFTYFDTIDLFLKFYIQLNVVESILVLITRTECKISNDANRTDISKSTVPIGV